MISPGINANGDQNNGHISGDGHKTNVTEADSYVIATVTHLRHNQEHSGVNSSIIDSHNQIIKSNHDILLQVDSVLFENNHHKKGYSVVHNNVHFNMSNSVHENSSDENEPSEIGSVSDEDDTQNNMYSPVTRDKHCIAPTMSTCTSRDGYITEDTMSEI